MGRVERLVFGWGGTWVFDIYYFQGCNLTLILFNVNGSRWLGCGRGRWVGPPLFILNHGQVCSATGTDTVQDSTVQTLYHSTRYCRNPLFLQGWFKPGIKRDGRAGTQGERSHFFGGWVEGGIWRFLFLVNLNYYFILICNLGNLVPGSGSVGRALPPIFLSLAPPLYLVKLPDRQERRQERRQENRQAKVKVSGPEELWSEIPNP